MLSPSAIPVKGATKVSMLDEGPLRARSILLMEPGTRFSGPCWKILVPSVPLCAWQPRGRRRIRGETWDAPTIVQNVHSQKVSGCYDLAWRLASRADADEYFINFGVHRRLLQV